MHFRYESNCFQTSTDPQLMESLESDSPVITANTLLTSSVALVLLSHEFDVYFQIKLSPSE